MRVRLCLSFSLNRLDRCKSEEADSSGRDLLHVVVGSILVPRDYVVRTVTLVRRSIARVQQSARFLPSRSFLPVSPFQLHTDLKPPSLRVCTSHSPSLVTRHFSSLVEYLLSLRTHSLLPNYYWHTLQLVVDPLNLVHHTICTSNRSIRHSQGPA